MLGKRAVFASLRSRSEKNPQMRREAAQIQGFSILLNQPISRVACRRGNALVSRKFKSSCCTIFIMEARTVMG